MYTTKRDKKWFENKRKNKLLQNKKSIWIIFDIKEKALEKNCLSICRQQKNKKQKTKKQKTKTEIELTFLKSVSLNRWQLMQSKYIM
jgi:hypothetical protein